MTAFVLTFLAFSTSIFGAQKLGKPLTIAKPMTVADVMVNLASLAGKTVQVKGKV